MGRMEDALKKAAEERERRRTEEVSRPAYSGEAPSSAVAASEPEGPRTAARAAAQSPVLARASGQWDERLTVLRDPHGAATEQFRKIRANVMATTPTPRTILVTSGSHGEGKSLFAANFALALAESKQGDVLLADANLRRPELATFVAARPGPGLSEALTGAEPDLAALIQKTDVPGVWFLAAGSVGPAAAQLLAPGVMKAALARIPSRFKYVVIDAPSAVEYADVALMAPDVDGVLIAVRVEGGTRSASKKAVEILEGARARVLGAVVWTGV